MTDGFCNCNSSGPLILEIKSENSVAGWTEDELLIFSQTPELQAAIDARTARLMYDLIDKTDRMIMEPILKDAVSCTVGNSTPAVTFESLHAAIDRMPKPSKDSVFDMRNPMMFYASDITEDQAKAIRDEMAKIDVRGGDPAFSRFANMRMVKSPANTEPGYSLPSGKIAFIDIPPPPRPFLYKDFLHDRDSAERFMNQYLGEPARMETVFGPSIFEKTLPVFLEFQRFDHLRWPYTTENADDGSLMTPTIRSMLGGLARRCWTKNYRVKRRHDGHLHRQRLDSKRQAEARYRGTMDPILEDLGAARGA